MLIFYIVLKKNIYEDFFKNLIEIGYCFGAHGAL